MSYDRAQVTALTNGRVLLDDGFAIGRTVLVAHGVIADVVPDGDVRARQAVQRDLDGQWLLPGFIDLQVNGGGGVLFNDHPTIGGLRAIAEAHHRFGTTGFLPTLISDDLEVVARAIDAVREAMQIGVPGVLGIHLEGPFLNPARKGAHDERKLRRLESSHLELLTSLGCGRTLVTLAPEVAAPGAVRGLIDAGVLVSAGHTDASADVARAAFDDGVRGVTHLFNAMSPLTSRAPGVVGAALDNQQVWCGLIVDGRHVDPAALRVALRCRPRDRFVLVTDAMPSVGAAETSFLLQGRRIVVRDGVCVDERGTLSGAHLDMAGAVRNATTLVGLPVEDAVRMASTYPAEFLGDHSRGRIAPGRRANFVVCDEQGAVTETWIEGRVMGAAAVTVEEQH